MKSIYLLFIFFICLTFTACEDTPVAPDALIGNWRTQKIIINGDPDSEASTWLSNNEYWIMGIQEEDHFYYRNYVSGTWSVEGRQLNLPNTWSGLQSFTILDVSPTTLTLQINLTEGEYCCDFDEFESDEVLTIVEHFVRE